MFPRILKQCKENILNCEFIVPVHALDELQNDDLSISDIERGILTGSIVERQKDELSGEWKYHIKGYSLEDQEIEIIVKLGPTGKLIIITAYLCYG